MSLELYRKYRPRMLKQVVGQKSAVSTLKKLLASGRVPHTLLFTGPSGCGKTTFARIVAKKLKAGKFDIEEVNAASERGIDMVRGISNKMGMAPLGGRSRVFIIDECQKLTSDAQSSLLKMLEDTPDHVYFMLCTTDPQKLLGTIKTRATEIKVALLNDNDMTELVVGVCANEKAFLSDDAVSKLVELAGGSARKALVLLHQIIALEGETSQLGALQKADYTKQGIDLARLLIAPKPVWRDVSKVLKELEDEPETVRRIVLGYAASVLMGGGKLAPRALLLIDVFGNHFYDSGFPGLVGASYAVATG